jgi:hypothetical protein
MERMRSSDTPLLQGQSERFSVWPTGHEDFVANHVGFE